MAQPTPYAPAHAFLSDEGLNPTFPGSEIDIELAAIRATFDQILANLEIIQRDDTGVANQTIGYDQLDAVLRAFYNRANDNLVAFEAAVNGVASDVAAAEAARAGAEAAEVAAQAAAAAAAEAAAGSASFIALSALTPAANKLPYFTGASSAH